MSQFTHLECSRCAQTYDPNVPQNLCTVCGKPLFPRYALDKIAQTWDQSSLSGREPSMWRYAELLPIIDSRHIVSLNESMTPLLSAQRLAASLELEALWVKEMSPVYRPGALRHAGW